MKHIYTLLTFLLLTPLAALHAADDSSRTGVAGKLTLANFHDSLLPKGFVLQERDWNIWCSAPMLADDGTVHLFVSRWPINDGFNAWHTTCEIAHYRADKPEGPYTYVETVLKGDGKEGSWRKQGTHNATVVRLPDQRYALLFIANAGGKRGGEGAFPANQKIGLMLANSLDGPWKLAGHDGLILDVPADPAVWSHGSSVGVNNPTLLVMADGSFRLYYKAMKPGKGEVRRMGVAVADKVEGPFRFEKEPVTGNIRTIEDGFAFLLNGEVCLLVRAGGGGGMIYHSRDGLKFDPTPVHAYEAADHYLKIWPDAKHVRGPWALERPALLLDRDGTPTHLFTASSTIPQGAQGTATFLFQIKPK